MKTEEAVILCQESQEKKPWYNSESLTSDGPFSKTKKFKAVKLTNEFGPNFIFWLNKIKYQLHLKIFKDVLVFKVSWIFFMYLSASL